MAKKKSQLIKNKNWNQNEFLFLIKYMSYKRLNIECGNFKNKLNALHDYTEIDKIVVEHEKLIIQPPSLFRSIKRFITGQNYLKLDSFFRREILANYISHLTEIQTLPIEQKYNDTYFIIINANCNLIETMLSSFQLLKNHYSKFKSCSQIIITIDKILSEIGVFFTEYKKIINSVD
jgi:hypothetical protein